MSQEVWKVNPADPGKLPEVPVTLPAGQKAVGVIISDGVVEVSAKTPEGIQVDLSVMAPAFPDVTTANPHCVFQAWPGSTGTRRGGERAIYVPVGDDGSYFGVTVGALNFATAQPHITSMFLAAPALQVAASACTRVGTWSSSSNAATYAGSYYYSVVSGATISASIKGTRAYARLFQSSNGGYGIVSIDGSYALPNRLPRFTAADLAAGRCRESDVGKPYVTAYGSAPWSEAFILADGLSDTTHTITIEATGTKPAASTDYRLIVEALLGGSADNKIGDANVHLCPTSMLSQLSSAWSEYSWVARYTPSGGTNNYHMGGYHACSGTESQEVAVTPMTFAVDNVDRTSATAGTYYIGTLITWGQTTTVAHGETPATPALTKVRSYTAMANRPLPVMLDEQITWSVAGTVTATYPVMLHAGGYDRMTASVAGLWPTSGYLGSARVTDFSKADDSMDLYGGPKYGPGAPRMIFVGPSAVLWCALDSESPPRGRQLSAAGRLAMQNRAYGDEKFYLASTYGSTFPVAVGDVERYVVGWGAAPAA